MRWTRPISIYEVHAGSWRRPGGELPDWDYLAQHLVPYVADLGFTHIELMPINEHPFYASWGYQPTGLFAPTARYGTPEAFRAFVAAVHDAGLQLILDWVPGHFPNDPHGLARFDGTALYEHADPREGLHGDWDTLIYNWGRNEVRNFLVGNALFWIERYGVDGLRVDAVASMLYRDYSRAEGEWIPNRFGGRENLEAIDFLRDVNRIVGEQAPGTVTMAEESTAFPGVTKPPWAHGLGFNYKWNMGWMHDTLAYFAHDPIHRRHHHDSLSFVMVYTYSEHFILPLSHDEVVHGKGSLYGRMPGDAWRKRANLKALFALMYAQPGRKLMFMGSEFGQHREWNHDAELDWGLLQDPGHAGVQRLVRDLNRLYRSRPALHERDDDPGGFSWTEVNDSAHSVFGFIRHGHAPGQQVLVACNFTPVPRHGYRMGVPQGGVWRECLNTDSAPLWRQRHGQPRRRPGRAGAGPRPADVAGPDLAAAERALARTRVGRMTPDAAARLSAGPALAVGRDADDVARTARCEPGRLLASRHRGALVPVRCGHRRRDRAAAAAGMHRRRLARLPARPGGGPAVRIACRRPWQPAAGHRFNAAKLLIDPYARELAGGASDLANEVGVGARCSRPRATRPPGQCRAHAQGQRGGPGARTGCGRRHRARRRASRPNAP